MKKPLITIVSIVSGALVAAGAVLLIVLNSGASAKEEDYLKTVAADAAQLTYGRYYIDGDTEKDYIELTESYMKFVCKDPASMAKAVAGANAPAEELQAQQEKLGKEEAYTFIHTYSTDNVIDNYMLAVGENVLESSIRVGASYYPDEKKLVDYGFMFYYVPESEYGQT